jgi:uncharacterized protein (DUF849 family)
VPANGKVIIACAVTRASHAPTMSPYLPTADEIIPQGEAAAEAGAAILHLHAGDEKTGRRAMGLTMGEMFYVRELAEDCTTDDVYDFRGPTLIITGGAGWPLNPQAIK